MLHRRAFAYAVLVLCALPGSVAAQSGTYDLHWVSLCGPGAFNPNQNAVSVQQGVLRIIVEQVDDGTLTFWTARNASTGAFVWGYADEAQVQDVDVGCAGSSYFGSFEWNPASTEDRFSNFHIYNAYPFSSREAGRFHAVGIRAAVTQAVAITRPTDGEVVSGTTRIDVTMSGFTTGSRNYVLLVDDTQRQFGTTSSNSLTLWFNTTRVANGTHSFAVRITQGGVTVQGAVTVVVRN